MCPHQDMNPQPWHIWMTPTSWVPGPGLYVDNFSPNNTIRGRESGCWGQTVCPHDLRMPFYVGGLSICRLWYPWDPGTNSPWIPRDNVSFGGSQKLYADFSTEEGVSALKPHVVQGSTVCIGFECRSLGIHRGSWKYPLRIREDYCNCHPLLKILWLPLYLHWKELQMIACVCTILTYADLKKNISIANIKFYDFP